MKKPKSRVEKDSLGEKNIPADALYGIQTLRAVENFPISGRAVPLEIVRSYAILKKCCAQVNFSLGLLPQKKFQAIHQACQEVIKGKHDEFFVVDVFQAGAGTSTNMNLNEVIANRALEILDEEKGNYKVISPNDDVNMAQSTNDTYPTAMRISIALEFPELEKSFVNLSKSLESKSLEFKKIIKSARTHLQDAVPISLGQEFGAWSRTISSVLEKIKNAYQSILVLGIGGTAAGTGLNAHPEFSTRVIKELKKETKLHFQLSPDLVESMNSQRQILEFMSSLRNAAVEISRIVNDLRLLSSGPTNGLAEIVLPPVQPGSSIMPGKINPSILECVNMVCFRVMGAESAVVQAVHSGQLDLNVFMPLMSVETLESMKILKNALQILDTKCIRDIKVNKENCQKYVFQSSSLATVLNPVLGYHQTAKIVKESLEKNTSIKDLLIKKGILDKEKIEELLDPNKML